MTVKIGGKIVGVALARSKEVSPIKLERIHMHEGISRPYKLIGATYKIKSPKVDNALYITINDIVLNEGTEFEHLRPFELFINSKNMDSFQWIVALTRIISAVFRKGGEITFLIDELKSIFDPDGGYFVPGGQGKYRNSVVAEIGDVLESHLQGLNFLDTKIETVAHIDVPHTPKEKGEICPACNSPTFIRKEGCKTCINCGYSSCG